MATIEIAPGIEIDEDEIEERFVRASGPGGQNVNKVSSAVQLRFDIARAPGLPGAVKARAMKLAGRRLARGSVVVIEAKRYRNQERNRADARARLIDLLKRALEAPKPRKRTKPPLASRKRRLETKRRRGALKRLRTDAGDDG
jgi:ribosome-associated protein